MATPNLGLPLPQDGSTNWGGDYRTAMATLDAAAASGTSALRTGSVVFTFDDGTTDHFTNAFPELSSRSLHGTFFIPTGRVGEAGKLTEAQVLEMLAGGQEIASHTHSEAVLSGASEAAIVNELAPSVAQLEAWGCPRPYTLAYVGGFHDRTAREVVGRYFEVARTVSSEPFGTTVFAPTAVAQTADIDVDSEADMQTGMSAALAAGTDYIVTCHFITGGNVTKLANLLDHAVSIGLPVRTLREVYMLRVQHRYALHGLLFGKGGELGVRTVQALEGGWSGGRWDVMGTDTRGVALWGKSGTDPSLRAYLRLASNTKVVLENTATDGEVSLQGDRLRVSRSLTENDTAVLIEYRTSGGATVQRVSVGAADSGGSGFRVLRVPN
jgi:peptidoglycan/xylan/chitin deacetylase (PgdA/CDA1 family)